MVAPCKNGHETHLSASVKTAGSDIARCGIERVLACPSFSAPFAPDNGELRSGEFNPVSGVRGDHNRGLSGGRYEIEDWRRDGGRLRDGDKWWCTGSDGGDVGEGVRISEHVAGGAVGERSRGTEIVRSRGPRLVRGSSGGRGIAAWTVFWATRGDRGGGETWKEILYICSLTLMMTALETQHRGACRPPQLHTTRHMADNCSIQTRTQRSSS